MSTKKTAKNKGGRPAVKWTDRDVTQFKVLCSQFNTEKDICAIMGVTDKTLVKLINDYLYEDITGHKRRGTAKKIGFSDAFEKYAANGRMSLRREQFRLAMNGDRGMLIWLGKQYLGQMEQPETSVSVDVVPRFYFDRSELN